MFENYHDMVSVPELQEMLCVSRVVAYQLLQENKISHFKLGKKYKIPKIAVEEYVLSNAKLR